MFQIWLCFFCGITFYLKLSKIMHQLGLTLSDRCVKITSVNDIKGTWCSSSFKIISVYMDETQRPQSERCEHWVNRGLWWTITHTVIILLGPCQQPHAHSPRLTLPFTYSVSIHKQALVYCNVSVAANKNCRGRKLSGSVLTRKWYISLQWDLSQCVWRPGGKRTSWMSFIHTFTTLGSFQ